VTREYELVLMLDPDVPDERRDEIAADTRKRIEAGGTLKNDSSWGMRKLAYEIRQRTEADYRLFRFEGQGGVLEELNHNLRIVDGVLRFRIFKVDPRSPSIVPPPPLATSGGPPQRGPRRQEAAAPTGGGKAAEATPAEEGEVAPEEGPTAPAAAPSEPADAGAEAPAEEGAEAPAEEGAETPAEDAAGEAGEEPSGERPAASS
jgi:small subunit ribosomal protein S6